MWSDEQRGRYENLRQREAEAGLTAGEQSEVDLLIREVEMSEAAYLRDATKRVRRERKDLEAQNGALSTLVHRKQALAERLHEVLTDATSEHQIIEAELSRILGHARSDAPSAHS